MRIPNPNLKHVSIPNNNIEEYNIRVVEWLRK
jgi:hypothetical protein